MATVKDAAYAWRQAIFFLSVAGPGQTARLLADESLPGSGPAVMAQLVADLRRVADGLQPDANRPPFVGWTVGRHWILDTIGHGTTPTR